MTNPIEINGISYDAKWTLSQLEPARVGGSPQPALLEVRIPPPPGVAPGDIVVITAAGVEGTWRLAGSDGEMCVFEQAGEISPTE
ncbi:MAG TPA: hypothetical protein VF329_04200 [Gammaproteobacteria bacterium]